jgi:RHS repeat-associated protein
MKTSGGEENLLIQDHITSTRIVESNKGEEQQAYYPYGMTNGEANTISDKQFTSHRSLADTGVYHAGARFYNPQLGVFVSADKVQGPNRYMYGAANPTLYTDPSGKIIPIIIAAIIIGGAAFGAGFGAGYEHGSQVAQYGSMKEPLKVAGAGALGGVAGAATAGATVASVAGVGYLGAVGAPAAIGAMSTGVGATGAVGLIGGAQIGVGACLSNPHCMNAMEAGAKIASGADLPPGFSTIPEMPSQGLRGTLDYYGDKALHSERFGAMLGKFFPKRVPAEHIGDPEDLVTVWKGLRAGHSGHDIEPSISAQSWLYGHEGDTGALINDRLAGLMSMGMTREEAITHYAWQQAIFPADSNPGTSWTTDINVARRYGKGGGIAQMTVPRSRLVSIPGLAQARGEWPTPQCAIECEMYHFGIVKNTDYTMVEGPRTK